jgi:putative redox protein
MGSFSNNDERTISFEVELSQHATCCFTQLPEVFNPAIKKWINPFRAATGKIIEQIKKCLSGALSFQYNVKKK